MSHKKHVQVQTEQSSEIDETILTASAAQPTGQEDIVDLQSDLQQCQQELQEANNSLLRAHADFDNYRKRMRLEREQEFTRGNDRVLMDILNIVDDFERALAAVNAQTTVESMQQGVALIHRQLLNMLERYEITAMTVEGERFDPKYHDAVARVAAADVPEHTIVAEVQRGYRKKEEVFRPARVAVAMPPDE